MNWLFPFYLFGAAAIIGPILMHLRRRPPQERVEFSSLMFLDAQTPMPVSKRRLENWLLLLLRCLALILLALMFARPWIRSESKTSSEAGVAVILLVDRSASMQRGNLWAESLDHASAALGSLSANDSVAVGTFDRELRSLWSFEEDKASAATRTTQIRSLLQGSRPGWSGTQLGQCLVDAAGWFARSQGLSGKTKRIVLISDLQEGSQLDSLRSIVWPEDVTVEVQRIDSPNQNNFTLNLAAALDDQPAEPMASGPSLPASPTARVRIANNRESQRMDFTLAWEKEAGEPIHGYLPAGGSRILAPSPRSNTATSGVLLLTGDSWDFDNRIFIAPAQPRRVRIAWVGSDAARDEASSPLYYLTRALQPTSTLEPEIVVVPPAKLTALTTSQVAFLSEAEVAAQRQWIEQGGLGILTLSPATNPKQIEALTGVPGISLSEAKDSDYRMLGEVQSDHPLLRPFADPRLRDFTKLRFWHHRSIQLTPDAARQIQTIASFDNGHPAMLVRRIGKGTLLLLTSGWHPADSQLALSTKFVPLLFGWLEAAGFSHEADAALSVGDPLPHDVGQPASVKAPNGEVTQIEPGGSFFTSQIGIYTVTQNASGQSPAAHQYAVNLPPDEGRVAPLDPQRLRDFGVKLDHGSTGTTLKTDSAEDQERLAASEEEQRQRGWWWILIALLALLGMETWLAGKSPGTSPLQEAQA